MSFHPVNLIYAIEQDTQGESHIVLAYAMILYTIYISTVILSLSLFSPSYVQDAKGFATCLLDFIGSNAHYLVSLMKMTSSDVDTSKQGQKNRLKHVEMTLETLYHIIHNNPEVEMQCIRQFKLLFSLLGGSGCIQGTTPGSEGAYSASQYLKAF